MKRTFITILAGAAMLSASTAFAASAPLAPGDAAGVQQAEGIDNGTYLAIGGGALVVAGIVVALSGSGNGTVAAVTTCTPTQTGATCPAGAPTTTTTTTTSTH